MLSLSQTQQKLYHAQDRVLSRLKQSPGFPYVLSGGTALSRFYFHHRFSEDLDFFCEEFEFSFEKVEQIVNHLRQHGFVCELVGRADQAGHLKIASYTVGTEPVIKVDFLEDPFSGMWTPIERTSDSHLCFRVDALDQIYYRKFFSLLEQWARARSIVRIKDCVDLYCLHCHHRSIEDTVDLFRRTHVPIDEEKLIMILSKINQKDLQLGLNSLVCTYQAPEIAQAFKQTTKTLLKRGLGQ